MNLFKKKDNTWEGPGCPASIIGFLMVIAGLCALGNWLV